MSAELRNLTITRGYAEFAGAAIFSQGDLILDGCNVVENESNDIAAGIYSISLRMTAWNSTFSGNAASDGGGALYIGGTTLGASTTYLTTSTLANNSAPLGSGVYGDVLPVFPLLDQRVIVRPQGRGCDVGSVEVVQGP